MPPKPPTASWPSGSNPTSWSAIPARSTAGSSSELLKQQLEVDALAFACQPIQSAMDQVHRGFAKPQGDQRADQDAGEHAETDPNSEDLRSTDATHTLVHCALLESDDRRRCRPELLEVIKLALGWRENVQDHVAVVQQHPARIGLALSVHRLATEFLEQLFAQVLQDGGCLALAARGADHEVI